jgi:hypothetical protein
MVKDRENSARELRIGFPEDAAFHIIPPNLVRNGPVIVPGPPAVRTYREKPFKGIGTFFSLLSKVVRTPKTAPSNPKNKAMGIWSNANMLRAIEKSKRWMDECACGKTNEKGRSRRDDIVSVTGIRRG